MAKQLADDLRQAGLLAEHLSEMDTAKELRQSVRTLRLWRQLGVGPSWTKIGRQIWYARTSLLNWIASQEHRPVRSAAKRG